MPGGQETLRIKNKGTILKQGLYVLLMNDKEELSYQAAFKSGGHEPANSPWGIPILPLCRNCSVFLKEHSESITVHIKEEEMAT